MQDTDKLSCAWYLVPNVSRSNNSLVSPIVSRVRINVYPHFSRRTSSCSTTAGRKSSAPVGQSSSSLMGGRSWKKWRPRTMEGARIYPRRRNGGDGMGFGGIRDSLPSDLAVDLKVSKYCAQKTGATHSQSDTPETLANSRYDTVTNNHGRLCPDSSISYGNNHLKCYTHGTILTTRGAFQGRMW